MVSLAEVFHPWVRRERPISGFESSSGGVWRSALGLRSEIWFANGLAHNKATGFQVVGLKLIAFILTF